MVNRDLVGGLPEIPGLILAITGLTMIIPDHHSAIIWVFPYKLFNQFLIISNYSEFFTLTQCLSKSLIFHYTCRPLLGCAHTIWIVMFSIFSNWKSVGIHTHNQSVLSGQVCPQLYSNVLFLLIKLLFKNKCVLNQIVFKLSSVLTEHSVCPPTYTDRRESEDSRPMAQWVNLYWNFSGNY